MFYNGLPRKKVLEIYKFVMGKREKLGVGQRSLWRMVKEIFGVEINESTISGWIFRGIVPFANEKTQFKPKHRPPREEIYNLYVKQKQSAEKMGKKYAVSTIIVINWLRSYGICTRTHLESMNTPNIKKELREQKLKRPTKDFSKMTPEKAYVLGVLCGDGYISVKAMKLEIRKDEEFIEEFCKCLEEVYGLKYKHRYYGLRNSFIVDVPAQIICEDLLKHSEFGVRKWRVPQEILESKNEKIIGCFLRGFYDSEGSVSRPAITSSSVNGEGIKQIRDMLQRLGIKTTLKLNGRKKNYWVLYIFRKERFRLFQNKVGFIIKRKHNKITEILNTGFFSKRSVA